MCLSFTSFSCFFFFNDTATTEIYTLSLHDALPISPSRICAASPHPGVLGPHPPPPAASRRRPPRQPRPVAHRPGPHALPPTDQSLCRAADQPRPIQARHPALPQALHRPRDLPPAHKPATHRRYRVPETGGIEAHQHGHDGAERWHASPHSTRRIDVDLVGALVVLVLLATCSRPRWKRSGTAW